VRVAVCVAACVAEVLQCVAACGDVL